MADFWPKPKPVVATTITVLEQAFPTMYIRSIKPVVRPSRYIVVGSLTNTYPNPAFTVGRPLIDCWAEDPATAEDMGGDVIQALKNAKYHFPEVKAFSGVQGPYELNDPEIQDRFRYQLHGDLYLTTR